MLKNKQLNMKKKQLLIIAIIVVLAVVACLTAYMLVNSQPESLNTLRISDSCTVEVPVDNNTVQNLNDGIKLYSFETHSLNITHEKNSNNSEIRELFSNLTKNCEKKEDNIYYDSSTGIYSTFIENSATGDGLIISSSDLDLLKRVSASLKFKNPKTTDIANDTNTTEEAEDIGFVEDTGYDRSYYPQDYSKNTPSSQSSSPSSSSSSSSDSNSKPQPSTNQT